MESHQRDHENFLVVSRTRRRRAKALLDFERHDDDELGFRKNDIITVSHAPLDDSRKLKSFLWFLTVGSESDAAVLSIFPLQIISQKDEHCWVGELNGLRGVWAFS